MESGGVTAPPLMYSTMKTLITLEVYSHGVRISGYTRETFRILAIFLERLALKEPLRIPQENRTVMELKKRFYGLADSRREAFIHRFQLDELLAYLHDRGINQERIEINYIPPPEAEPAVFEIYDHYEPREYQLPIIDFMSAPDKPTCRLDLQTGKGKLQPLYSRIKVPGGWSTMGEMEVGAKVTAWDGTTANVTGVYPNGTKPIYRVTFWDGRCTEAGPEHLWKAFYVNTVPHRRWRVIDTMELKRLSEMPNPRVYVPLCQSEEGPEVKVAIPPYTLGVVLGDGHINGAGIQITKLDDFVFDEVLTEAPEGSQWKIVDHKTRKLIGPVKGVVHPYQTALRDYELWGQRSWEKYIPQDYLHGSTEQRWALLQGLMDTDGTVNTRETGGAVSFNSTSRRMAGQVQYLVRSLGGIASISERNTQYTYNGEKHQGRTSYDVNIRHPQQQKLFRLPRKRDRIPETNQYSEDLKLRVRSVEYLGEEPAQCISIDHPDQLYITNDFIVTHNTFCALKVLSNLGVRCVVMVSPKYFGIWKKALKETYKDIEHRFCTVSGSAELKALIEKGVEDELDYDVIIISNVTYRSYLESYERFGEQISTIGYLVPPPRFHEAIRAGFQINDEFQDDPGLVFRTDVYTNIKKQAYLSATPFTGNEFVTRMIDVMMPGGTECPLPDYDQYINVIGLLYQEPGIQRKDYLTPFKNTYNHARYETQMLKKKKRLERYKRIVFKAINGIFIRDRVPGQKLLVLCATVNFIHHLTTELKKQYPDLKIGEFVAGSNPETLQTNDITVSTIKSAGTGQDIIDLREVLLLQATDSKKDNIQILGRLRRMKNFPEHTPRMTYMVCTDIRQHMRYFSNKKEHFDGRVVSHRVMRI